MDDPDADLRMLERTYDRFQYVNAVVSRPGRVYREVVRPRARHGVVRVLDIGAGGGDLCRSVAAHLRRDGLRAEITALDPDERAMAWAAAHDDGAGIRYRPAHSSELVAAGERFDVVLSNHLLHHLSPEQLAALLADSERLVDRGGVAVHHDIARSRAAYAAFSAGTALLARTLLADSFIRIDGLLSIRRSYTAAELASVVPASWRVRSRVPARLEVRWEQADARP